MGRWIFLSLVLVAIRGASPAAAQLSDIRGRVMDRETGEAVQDATVVLEGQDTAFRAVTDNRGLFDFVQVGNGTYRAKVEHLAYGRHVQELEVEGGGP